MTTKWIGANKNNFEVGRSGKTVSKIVLHWIVGQLEAADITFQDPKRIASAHYGIGDNEIHQYVNEEDTAYHAGNLTVNRESIGIEHDGGPDLPISEATIQTSIQLVAELCRKYNVPADKDHIKRHSDIKATQCPGTLPVERIIAEVAKLLHPANGYVWIKDYMNEKGIDITNEGDARSKLGDVFDESAKYDQALKDKVRAQNELQAANARVTEVETENTHLKKDLQIANNDLIDKKQTVIDRDIEIGKLKQQLADAGAPVVPQPAKNWLQRLLEFIRR